MKKSYPYLQDEKFLYLADTEKLQNQYVKLTLLDWDENPLEEIQGIATGGTVSLNGDSAIRRTCSLNMTVKDISTGKITDTKNLISINKKVYLEIGIENKTNQYSDYPILWYPQGLFIFTSCSVSFGVGQATTLSAQLKDKMCLLNGECGGTITSAVQLDTYDTIEDSTGQIILKKPLISQIIKEVVNHFGNENLARIIVHDVDDKIKTVMKWTAENPLYLATKDNSHLYTTNEVEAIQFGGIIQELSYGMNVGFILEDFIYPSELTANAGDSVCTILDKIKNLLGNYEYYYDIWGNFIWQEIKDYLNTTQATVELNKMKNDDYIIDIAKGKSVYSFLDGKLITNYSNSPQYNRIKNDYVVWGIKEDTNNIKIPIRYHLVIDKKPQIGNIYEVFFYIDPIDGLKKAKCPIKYSNVTRFPYPGVEELFYMSENTGIIYKWDAEKQMYVSPEGYCYEEYDNINDFPDIGQYDIIYISTSTNKQYIWSLNPGSAHYQTVINQLNILKNEYDIERQGYLDIIDNINMQISNLKEQETDLYNQYIKWIIPRNQLNKQIELLTSQINTATEENVELQELIDTNSNLITQKLNQIAILEDELEHETDPVRRAQIQSEIDSLNSDIEKLQEENNRANNKIIQNNNNIINWTEEKTETEESLVPLNDALVDYDNAYNDLENQISNKQELINNYNEVLNNLERTYETNKTNYLLSQPEYIEYEGAKLVKVKTTDWRSELYLDGVSSEPLGLANNYYYAELAAEWPKLYNLQANSYIDSETGDVIYTGDFYQEVKLNPWDVNYWLDFIDSEAAISQFNVSNIGRRSIVENRNEYNCIFESDIPDIVIIENNQSDTQSKIEECEKRGQDYYLMSENLYNMLIIGGLNNSCFNRIKELLWDYTDYNSSISLSVIPIYHLEPNTRITVQSIDADIHGDFMIKSISIPLTISGTMNIAATQVQTKL